MAEHSTIEWTDATWNVITGCSIESPGCTNCYAMKLAGTRLQHHPSRAGLTKPSAAGPVWTGEVRFNEQWLDQPSRWRRARDIFVCAHGDLFHPAVPFEWIDRVFMQMQDASHHTFQVLTKRPARMLEYLQRFAPTPAREGYVTIGGVSVDQRHEGSPIFFGRTWPLQHVLLGTSVENQRYADERRESLRQAAALGWRTWVSYEPALGPVDWSGWEFLKWCVSGGESGPGARPSHPHWHRAARDFCASCGIAYHFKQHGQFSTHEVGPDGMVDPPMSMDMKGLQIWTKDLGFVEIPPHTPIGKVFKVSNVLAQSVGKAAAGRLLDGVEHNGMPA